MVPSAQGVQAMLAAEREGAWAIEAKVDGVRSLIHLGARVSITNRRGVDWTSRWPEVVAPFEGAGLPAGTVLDAEIACLDYTNASVRANFPATASRAKLTRGMADAALSKPAYAHVFDVLAWGGRQMAGEPYAVRRGVVDALGAFGIAGLIVVPSHTAGFQRVWDAQRRAGAEGVVVKHLSSPYRGGPTRAWRKTKIAHTTTAVAVGYEAGAGPNGFGALHLAVVSAAKVIPAGRVGSGLSESEIAELTAAIDAGDMPVVEIGHNGITSGGHLRHPVYRGRRADATWRDARADQIH